MSFKDQFNKASTIRALSNKSAEEIAAEVESVGYHEEDIVREERFIPRVDFTRPESFVRYGSATEYYEQSLKRIYEDYPYDGSLREKIKWENESTYLDLHIFNNRYPRTNGYALFSPAGWGTVSSGSGDTGYGLPADLEYIYLKGGPHANLHGMSPYSIQFTGSNYYDTDKNRENNLKFDLKDNGISVEFWLRKAAFDASKTQKEVIFDLWNGEASSSAQYGRFRIELTGAANESGADPFRVTLVSGTTGFVSSSVVASTFTTSSVADDNWHHYAFTFKSASAGITSRFYVDGTLNNECLSGTIAAAVPANSATAVDAIDTTGVVADGGDCTITITIPAANGGDTTGGAGAITILLDASETTGTPAADNQIGIGILGESDSSTATLIKRAINNTSNSRIIPASAGSRGTAGVPGITAAEGSSNTQLTLTMDAAGAIGNVTSVLANATGPTIVDVTDFTGGGVGEAAGMNEVTGALRAYMGALITPNHRSVNPAAAGAGKLSGSIDEFRYWKTERTAKEIGRHWFTQVGGGTNEDPQPGITTTENVNTKLGVYYKFNEGITGVTSTDSVVLDYSGRLTNGAWTGYSSDSRNTGSAIVSSSAAIKEFKDPIIYKFHPSVETLAADLQITGSEYDVNNNASIYNSIPAWITEEDSGDKGQKQLKYLTQIMSSYFDTLQLQIESLANLKDITYNTGSNKPLPFAEKLLSSAGLFAPEIFIDADVLEKLADRSENRVFEKSLHDVKNTIYQNIYNNLVYIYKTKGTEKAFRNMIRCFGIDDELVKLNMYAGGIEYEARDNRRNTVSVVDRFVNFNTADNSNAVVYQQQDASDTTDTTGYFPANSKLADGYAQTFEADINFPKKPDANASFYFDTNTISSSLFGVHGVVSEESVPQWDDTADAANYQVFAVRDEIDSTNVRFVLTGTEGGYVPYLVSDLYQDTYEDSHWNLAVRIKPENYPYAGTKPGGEFGVLGGACCGNYTVELHGIQIDAGVVRNEFNLSGLAATESDSLKKTPAGFITGSKRVYIGTHRTNFTGTILNSTDVKVNACRYWFDYVEDETLLGHAYDTENYGSLKPRAYAYPFDFSGSYGDILKLDTLALNWEFSQNTGSDASGQFTVKDRSSGSATTAAARFGWLGNYLNRQYSGKGYDFLTSSSTVVDKDFVVSSKLQLPENVQSSEMVTVLNAQEQNVFTRDSRPINYFFAFEKSMAQAVSTEMINYFATLKDINTLIGAPVNRYRPEYKGLKILRQRFFERVGNSEIDFEKFYEFYKWFDSTLTIMLQQLVPASADFAENVRTVVESHVLERSKYQSKFQNVKKQLNDIEAVAVGSETDTESTLAAATNTPGSGFETPNKNTNRQTGDSDLAGSGQAGWKWSTPGLDEDEELDETVNREYWKYEAEADSPVLSQSAAAVNEDKQIIRANIRVTKHRAKGSVYRFSAGGNSTLGGVGFNQNKKVDFIYNATTPYGETSQGEKSPENMILASGSGAEKLQGTSDDIFPAVSQRLGFDVDPDINKNNDSDNKNDGNLLVPFSLYSSSVESGFNQEVIKNYASGVMITNLHHDLVYDNDIPMQGTFAEKFVGGRSHRHIEVNKYDTSLDTPNNIDSRDTRPEAWQLKFKDVTSSGGDTFKSSFAITPANYDATLARGHDSNIPTAHRLRNVGTKRPVNIQNVLMTTASTEIRLDGVLAHGSIGNYQKNYQIVQSAARSKNDPFFRDESFKFARHPETLSIRGRLPLDPPFGRSLEWNGDPTVNGSTNLYLVALSKNAAHWDHICGGAASNAKAFSISTWAYLKNYGNSSTGILFNLGTLDRYAQMQSNKLRFVIDGTTQDGFVESSTLSLNQWYHVTLTFAGGDPGGSNTADYMKVYIDGALDSAVTQELNAPDDIAATVAYLGCNGYASNTWGGNICDFALWTKELSAAEVAEVYNNGTRFNLRIASPATASLYLWYKLGDGHSPGDRSAFADPGVDSTYTGYLFDEAGGSYGYARWFATSASTLNSPPYGAVGPSWAASGDLSTGGSLALAWLYPGDRFPGGTLDYALPDRTGANSNKSIIVTRFGAPGGPEVQSRGYMDPAHEEMSVYNALPYRNRSVIDFGGVWRDKLFTMRSFFEGPGDAIWYGGVIRGLASSSIDGTITASINTRDHLNEQRGLNQLSALRCGKYGSDATYGIITEPRHQTQHDNHNYSLVSGFTRVDRGLGYCETPSFHKVNRNPRKIIKSGSATQTYGGGPLPRTLTSSVYDNLYIQHQIPQNMSQYTWVTASMWKGIARGDIIARGTTLAEGRLGVGTGGRRLTNSPAFSAKRAALFLAPLSYPTCYSASTLEIICTSSLVASFESTGGWGGKPPGCVFPYSLPTNQLGNITWREPGVMHAGNFGTLQVLIKDPVCEWPIDDENPSAYLGAEPSMSMENTLGYPLQGMKWIGDSNEMHNPYDFTPLCWDWLYEAPGDMKIVAPKNKFQYANRYLNISGSPTNAEGFINVFKIVGTDALGANATWDPRNASAYMFNVLMTHRNGPYGYPTFKQVRTGQHPVSRWLRKNNLIGALVPPPVIRGGNGTIQGLKSNKFVNYKEMPIASNAMPITFAFEDNDEDPNVANNIILNVSYQNNLDYFTNQGLNNRLNLGERKSADDGNAYNTLADFTLESNLSTVIRFGQKIYPAAENVYQSKVRTRENYDIRTIWNDVRQFRSTQLDVTGAILSGYNGTTSSMGFFDPSASMWPLDGRYGTRSVSTPNALGESYANTGSTMGELLNTYSRYGIADGGTLRPGPSYVMPLRMGSGSNPDGATDPSSWVVVTGPEWEAPAQAGVNPYQPYEDYGKTIRLIGKDMSIIPEFRISEHIETYFDVYAGNFLAKFDNMLSLTGAALSGTAPTASNDRGALSPDFYKVYSTTDFMKYFKIVDDDLVDQANAADNKIRRHSLELTCDAVLQFLPYKGFYPAERTLELASLLSKSMGKRQWDTTNYGGTAADAPGEMQILDRILYEPLMAPGILYNTIKSGIAVSNFLLCNKRQYLSKTSQILAPGEGALPHLTNSVGILPLNSGSAWQSAGDTVFVESIGVGHEDGWLVYRGSGNADFEPPGVGYNSLPSNRGFMPMLDLIGSGSAEQDVATANDPWGGFYMHRLPFEAIRDPEKYLGQESVPGGWIYDTGIYSASIWDSNKSVYLNPRGENFYTVYSGIAKKPFYKLAIDNFLCETYNFFQPGPQATTFLSKEEDSFGRVEKDKYYGLKVDLAYPYRKSSKYGWRAPRTFCMYSRASAFGVPLVLSGTGYFGSGYGTGSDSNRWATFEHVLPPYYYGHAAATIIFKAPYSGKVTVDEIIANSTVEFEKSTLWDEVGTNSYYDKTIVKFDVPERDVVQSQIDTSVDLFEKYLVVPEGTNTQKARWMIRPKFETPIMNFLEKPTTPLNTGSMYNYNRMGTTVDGPNDAGLAVRGMWHQYGRPPTASAGLTLDVTELPTKMSSSKHGQIKVESLANLVGFNTTAKRIGQVASSKRLEEAIVCIPFRTSKGERKFFDVDKDSQEYVTQLALLNKYIFPPTFDFLINEDVSPVAFYAFEFNMSLTQDDLINIWQNLPPDSQSKFQKTTTTIKIRSLVDRLLDNDEHLQWMVFKVKRKAEKDYNVLVKKKLGKGLPIVQPAIDSPYSYNWPYDYFSFVELIKIKEQVVYATEDIITEEDREPPVIPDLREFIPAPADIPARSVPRQDVLDIPHQGRKPGELISEKEILDAARRKRAEDERLARAAKQPTNSEKLADQLDDERASDRRAQREAKRTQKRSGKKASTPKRTPRPRLTEEQRKEMIRRKRRADKRTKKKK